MARLQKREITKISMFMLATPQKPLARFGYTLYTPKRRSKTAPLTQMCRMLNFEINSNKVLLNQSLQKSVDIQVGV